MQENVDKIFRCLQIAFLLTILQFIVSEGVNLLYNSDFDDTYEENGFIKHWSCQGEGNSFKPVLRTMHNVYKAPFSGLCTRRTNKFEGPCQLIDSLVLPDHLYKVQGWTRLLNGKSKEDNSSIELWLRWKVAGVENEEKKLLGLRNKFLKNDDWVFWNTQFHIPSAEKMQYVLLYFKGPPKYVDIMIDEMKLEPIQQRENWRQDTDDQIDSIRKRDVLLRVQFPPTSQFSVEDLKRTRLEVKQLSNEFAFGASVYYEAVKKNEEYRSFVKDHFEWATMEHALKWPYMEPIQGSVNYSMPDELMDILIKDMGMNVRGHCIFWAVPEEQPKWLINSTDLTIKASVKRRMYDVLNRYKSSIDVWDINNEMLHGSYFGDKIGETVRDWMFFEAHKIFPDGRFFVNDYEVLSAPFFTQSYIEEIKRFKSRGVPLAGIGVQGHFPGSAHPEILKDRLDALATLDLPIWITELDVKNANALERAETLEKVLRIAFAHPAVHGIMLWSFWDKHDWRGNTSLFTGPKFKPNEAGKRYIDLRTQWTTNIINLEPSYVGQKECVFTFRAFHGTYLLEVTLPDERILTKVVNVMNDPRKLILVFKEHSDEEPP